MEWLLSVYWEVIQKQITLCLINWEFYLEFWFIFNDLYLKITKPNTKALHKHQPSTRSSESCKASRSLLIRPPSAPSAAFCLYFLQPSSFITAALPGDERLLLAPPPVKLVRAGRETNLYTEREREGLLEERWTFRQQTESSSQTDTLPLFHWRRTVDRHIFSTLHHVRSDIYWEATAPLTSPIDCPALPLRLTGVSTGRGNVSVCLGVESFRGNRLFLGVFMGWSLRFYVWLYVFIVKS